MSTRGVCALLAGILWIAPISVRAASPDSPDLYKACYLEKQEKNYAGARDLYAKVLAAKPSDAVRIVARAGADRCRDQLASQNFASLMPADSVVYVELSRPGEIIGKLAAMLGLTTADMQGVLAERPNLDGKAPFHVPTQFVLSPTLLDGLGSFGGGAVGLTAVDPSGNKPPKGVAAIHFGDVTLVKGLLETAFQFAPTGEKIDGLPTFATDAGEAGHVTGVMTESLLIVGSTRELVSGAVARLTGKSGDSLATRGELKEVLAQSKGATVSAWVDLQAMMTIAQANMNEGDRREFATANALADLKSLRWASFCFGIQDGVLGSQVAVRFADDHHSLVYNLMRLPPLSRRGLKHVPGDAAGVVALGLNPALTQSVANAAANRTGDQAVTGLDIGREFFGNVQELCAFCLPRAVAKGADQPGGHPIPHAGVILAVNDVARSKALWNQLLSIPGLMQGKHIESSDVKIEGKQINTYTIPEMGTLYMGEIENCVVMTTTRAAMQGVLRTGDANPSILQDVSLGKTIARVPADSSFLVAAHIGRVASMVGQMGDPGQALAASQVSAMCKDTVVWLGLGQSTNQFSVRWAVSGLPQVNEAMKTYGPMIGSMIQVSHSHETHGSVERKHRRIARRPVKEIPEVKE